MSSKENRKKQLHTFIVKSANNIFMFASVCSISATAVQVKLDKMIQQKMHAKQINIKTKGK
jgi:hypothetical protein